MNDTAPQFYTYKWVSAVLMGKPDWDALRRAAARGWEPVPKGEEPPDIGRPVDMPGGGPFDMGESFESNFRLHRMPLEEHRRRKADLEYLNAALADNRVHVIIAQGNIQKTIDEMRARGVEVGKHWDPKNRTIARVPPPGADVPEQGIAINGKTFKRIDSRGNAGDPATIDEDVRLLQRVEIAYKFLHDRGLA